MSTAYFPTIMALLSADAAQTIEAAERARAHSETTAAVIAAFARRTGGRAEPDRMEPRKTA